MLTREQPLDSHTWTEDDRHALEQTLESLRCMARYQVLVRMDEDRSAALRDACAMVAGFLEAIP